MPALITNSLHQHKPAMQKGGRVSIIYFQPSQGEGGYMSYVRSKEEGRNLPEVPTAKGSPGIREHRLSLVV
jgi:hypothetical protein